MAAVTLALGGADGASLSIVYDDRTGVLSKVTVTNSPSRSLHIVIGALGATPYHLKTRAGGSFTVPAVQPVFTLDAEKRPTNLVASFAACRCASTH